MVRGQTRGQDFRAEVALCPAACGGGTLPRAQDPHLSSARGGLGRRRDPGLPRATNLGAELQARPCRPGRGTAWFRRPRGRGRSPPRGGAPGGTRGVPSGPASGLCLRARRASGIRSPIGAVASLPQPGPPRASSPELRAAASRALRPRLGLARLRSVRFGSPREEPPGLRLARGGASGSVLIGQGPGVESACPSQPRPRAGSRGDLSSGGAEASWGGWEGGGQLQEANPGPRRGAQAASL